MSVRAETTPQQELSVPPLRTLEGARDAVRELRRDGDPEGGITVYLREGVYYQPQTLELTEEDSATETCPITYAAYNGESVTVTGGYSLDPSKFTETGDNVKARLVDKKAKEKVLAYDLKAISPLISPAERG